jgi:hypothetical protein
MHQIIEIAPFAPMARLVWDIIRYCLEQRRKKQTALPSA